MKKFKAYAEYFIEKPLAKYLISLCLVFFILAAIFTPITAFRSYPDLSKTPIDENNASYLILRDASDFSYGPIGYSGTYPQEICAFGQLLEAENGVNYFYQLLKRDSAESQMYGLCGLFFLDYSNFKVFTLSFAADERELAHQVGCIGFRFPVKDFVFSEKLYTIRLRNNKELIDQWLIRTDLLTRSYLVDVYSGGIPLQLKDSYDRVFS